MTSEKEMKLKRRACLSVTALAIFPGLALLGFSAFFIGTGGPAWRVVFGIIGGLALVAGAITLPAAWGMNLIASFFPGEDMSVEIKHGRSLMKTIAVLSSIFGLLLGSLFLPGNDIVQSLLMIATAIIVVGNCSLALKSHWLSLLEEQHSVVAK